nr:sigma-70 family RNA polymerase sigma factor [Paenibacillus sp. GSMTC-2017]
MVARIRDGDEEAFSAFFESTRAHTYSMVYFLIGNERDVEDISSEVYIALFRSLSSYSLDKPFLPWFNGLIIRQSRSWKRRIWRSFRLMDKVKSLGSPQQSLIDTGIDAIGNSEEVLPHVNRLSRNLREVIVLRYYQDYSLETIAEVLSIPIGTVKSRNHAALKKLRYCLEDRGEEKEVSTYVH